jgi:O-antigen/teichoic acid export membrane protein
MYARLKKLLGESMLYSLGNIIRRSVSIVTMPVFTRYMSMDDYGTLSLVRSFQNFLSLFYEMGTAASSTRFYYDCNDKDEKIRLFSTLFIFIFGLALIVSLFLLLFGEAIWVWIFKDIPFYPYAPIAILAAQMTTAGVLTRTLFRVHGQAKRLVMLNTIFTVVNLGLAVPSVVVLDMGAVGPLLVGLITMVAFFFIYMRYLWEYLSLQFSLQLLKRALAFGIPEMPVRFGNWTLQTLNQLILQHHWSLSVVALYSVAFSVATILFELIINAVHWAIQPFYYQIDKEESDDKAKEIFAYVGCLNTTVILFLGLLVLYYGPELLRIFASSKYSDAEPVIALMAFSAIFQFLFFIPSRAFYIRKKTLYLPPILFLTVGCNVVFGLLLIPEYGMMGAAWATLIAFFCRVVVTLVLAQRVYYVPYDYLRIGKALFAFVIVYGIKDFLPNGLPIYFSIPLKGIVLTAYPVTLLALGYFQPRELQRLRQILLHRQ